MALELGDDAPRLLAIAAGLFNAVPVLLHRALQPAHVLAALAGREAGAFEIDRSRPYPMSDVRFAQQLPRKLLAGVLLARRGDVGMAEHAVGRNLPAAVN